MKQMDMQRREQQRRAAQGLPTTDYNSNSGGFGQTPNSGGYAAVNRYDSDDVPSRSDTPNSLSNSKANIKAPAFKGKGLKLGATKKLKEQEVLGAFGAELSTPDMSRGATPDPGAGSQLNKPSVPSVERAPYVLFRVMIIGCPSDPFFFFFHSLVSISKSKNNSLFVFPKTLLSNPST